MRPIVGKSFHIFPLPYSGRLCLLLFYYFMFIDFRLKKTLTYFYKIGNRGLCARK
jgi:hypothetical protein